MELKTLSPIMPGMSDTQINTTNGHNPALAVTIPAVPWPQVAASPLGGGDPRTPSAQPEAKAVPQAGAKRKSRRKLENFLTWVGSAIAIAGAGVGMWKFWQVQMHIDNLWLRAALSFVFEVFLIAFTLRARRYYIKYGFNGKDARTAWIMSACSGVMSALDEHSLPPFLMRLALPLLAAYGLQAAFHAEREDAEEAKGNKKRRRIHLRFSPERILIALGLADPTERDVAEVDRARTIARLATIAHRAHTTGWPNRGRARRKFNRNLAKANERLSLAKDQSLVAEIRSGVALLYQGLAATHPAAVDTASPWTRVAHQEQKAIDRQQPRPAPAAAPRRQVTADVEIQTSVSGRTTTLVPAGKTRRSTEDTLAAYVQLKADEPNQSQPYYAKKLGITAKRLFDVRRTDPNDPAYKGN